MNLTTKAFVMHIIFTLAVIAVVTICMVTSFFYKEVPYDVKHYFGDDLETYRIFHNIVLLVIGIFIGIFGNVMIYSEFGKTK